jgi:hypothetical protein
LPGGIAGFKLADPDFIDFKGIVEGRCSLLLCRRLRRGRGFGRRFRCRFGCGFRCRLVGGSNVLRRSISRGRCRLSRRSHGLGRRGGQRGQVLPHAGDNVGIAIGIAERLDIGARGRGCRKAAFVIAIRHLIERGLIAIERGLQIGHELGRRIGCRSSFLGCGGGLFNCRGRLFHRRRLFNRRRFFHGRGLFGRGRRGFGRGGHHRNGVETLREAGIAIIGTHRFEGRLGRRNRIGIAGGLGLHIGIIGVDQRARILRKGRERREGKDSDAGAGE